MSESFQLEREAGHTIYCEADPWREDTTPVLVLHGGWGPLKHDGNVHRTNELEAFNIFLKLQVCTVFLVENILWENWEHLI